MIDKTSIENLKQRLDIVDVVGSYLELKKNGANYKCVCPFHNDTTPSLVVSPSKQIYHCFACGAGGDSIKFVMEYEKLSYPEAIEKLARMVNFSLAYTTDEGGVKREDRKLMENLNLFYVKQLDKTPFAKEYLFKRGISDVSIEKFELGYAPASFATLDFLKMRGYAMSEAMEYGVAGLGENNQPYARFIERVSFPIYSPTHRLVGFGGRTLSNHPAKYVNSPQTKHFNKSQLLYGYHLAKESVFKEKKIIVTEGYLDVIMLHQAGFTQAVATLGTALTSEHIPLLMRGDPEIIVAYDGDSAGINAALKASVLLSTHGLRGGVVLFSNGMDPADMVQNGLIDTLNRLFLSPQPFIEFALERIVKKYDLKDPLVKQQALNEATAYLKTLPKAVQESYTGLLSGTLNISQNLVKIQTHKPTKQAPNERSFEDMLELTIIKTILSQPGLIDTVLDTIDHAMFKTHQEEFLLLLENRLDHPKLRRILLWDDVKVYDENELIASMAAFLYHFYNEKFQAIKTSKTLSYEQKQFMIRKIQEKLMKLKKGELVPYESISPL
ncbi:MULTISPECIES: DNA primase [unclassified Sulfurospirillum]|jgi:DNA primase|uniref:DNA primase n=1 Tax=unclassified Sulfurospirillum TaxID=2618290 RepID=UPI000541B86B|nr:MULTISPECIES: DNA primase [unclassified Sulfurospirillum]KHG33960.1 MAG: DNA primase [Sulfurospirillum sp. MES]MCD8543519.1 DNA primase [Sulfurospirillum cavolei]MCP3652688.1 DNA primase [Sulfurospirillum sp. DNRA8]MCR1811539.1 DNA primase [Sulfurospirillum sp. DNRA8]